MILQMQILDYITALIGFVLLIAFVIGVPIVFGIGTLLIAGFLCTTAKAFF